MSLRNFLARTLLSPRMRAIEHFERHPLQTQRQTLRRLIERGAGTEWGRQHDLRRIRSIEEFQSRVPVADYDTFKPYIDRMRQGVRGVTAPERVRLFARSSGTTSDRSKYIPVTEASLRHNHLRGMRDVAALYLDLHPDSRIMEGRILTLGGSCAPEADYTAGDLSALLIHRTRHIGGWLRLPDTDTALIGDFDRKVEAICRTCGRRRITAFAGVPSWNLALMRGLLDHTGKRHLLEVWPDLELFVHGGVEFAPYRQIFAELIPSAQMHYLNTYNASEGFFAIADRTESDEMLLMLDYGTFYEFRECDGADTNGAPPRIVPLDDVVCGRPYALVITSENGLWRYEIGDRVEFTSLHPHRIRFAGRTRQYLNSFGEELIVENTDRALLAACHATGAVVQEYCVVPRFMTLRERGAHEWFVEFARDPDTPEHFAESLDRALCALNSDYEAKRHTTLDRQTVTPLPHGTFLEWMRRERKNKVPRLTGDRRVAESLLGARRIAPLSAREAETEVAIKNLTKK